MWLKREQYERLVSESALALQVPKLELRVERAEDALTKEREVHQQEIRHLVSMWLRRNGSYPLPSTPDEKAEAKAEKQAQREQPPKLNEDQLAQLKAAIAWGQQNGFTEEESTRSFMAQLVSQR